MENSTIKIEENKITTKTFFNEREVVEVWEPLKTPIYFIGQQFFDFEGERYFLTKKSN